MELPTFLYFLLHAPLALVLDAQAVLPSDWFPQQARTLLQQYANYVQDPFLKGVGSQQHLPAPTWFRGLIWCELLLQVPVFLVLAYGYGTTAHLRARWVHVLTLVYGVHVATAMVPILFTLVEARLWMAVGVYAPWMLISLWLATRSSRLLFGGGRYDTEIKSKKSF